MAGDTSNDIDRRSAMAGAAGLGTALLIGGPSAALAADAPVTALTKARRDAMSPDDVVQAMLDGNRRYLAGERRNPGDRRPALTAVRTVSVPISLTASRIHPFQRRAKSHILGRPLPA
jgi:hypothetical protein